jgi:hypothetical protein
VLLIHGYNNSQARAHESFEQFRRNLAHSIPRHELWELHWPGDHPKRIVSMTGYFGRVNFMEDLGAKLARFLGAHPATAVCLIAHSLGCRATLETLRALNYASSRVHVGHVFLLAAAVPVPLCDGDESRFPAPVAGSREHVFYSRRDRALRYLFERGQAQLNENEHGPAVGLNGDPGSKRWTSPFDTGCRHGRYWRSPEVCREILYRMGDESDRQLPRRRLPVSPLDPESSRGTRLRLPMRELPRR